MPSNTPTSYMGQGNYGDNYQYHDGQSEDSYVQDNAFSQDSGYGLLHFANPVEGVYSGIRGRQNYKKQRAAYEHRMRAKLMSQRQGQYSADQQRVDAMQAEDDSMRNRSLDQLDYGFKDPRREAARQAGYQTNLQDSLSGLTYDYGKQKQSAGLQMAKRGRLGSSHDAEVNSGLSNALNMNAMGAENNARDYYSKMQDSDTSQYENLRRALLSGDPQMAQQYEGMAQGASNDASRLYGQAAWGQNMAALDREAQDHQSQLYGGIGSAGANYVYGRYGVQNPGR